MNRRVIRLAGIGALLVASLMIGRTPADAKVLRPIKPVAVGPHVMKPSGQAGIQPPGIFTLGLETPALGVEFPTNLAYFGGQVMNTPKAYLVFWGWGGRGHDANNVDGLLQHFFDQIGGTSYSEVLTQYSDSEGGISNPVNQLAGVWYDEAGIHDNLTRGDFANEAARAVAYFNGGSPDPNANYFIATPKNFNDAGFNAGNYCAYHDFSTNFSGVTPGIAFSVMPYVANNPNCGTGFVTSPGTLDGVTMVAGHEYQEAITDPDVSTGWIDLIGNENGDKCAFVALGPGTASLLQTRDGSSFPIQSSWSNIALAGVGSCTS